MTGPGRCPDCDAVIRRVEGGPDPQLKEVRVSFAIPCGHRIDYRTAIAANVPVIIDPTNGITLMGAERRRQVTEEGYTPEHDAAHDPTELPWAAWCYLDRAVGHDDGSPALFPPTMWPEGWEWKPDKSPMLMLIQAGALIAAELDRRLAAGEVP